jgi:catalase
MTTYFDKTRLTARLAISSFAILIATISARAMGEEGATAVTPVQVVDSLEATFGVHPGQPRNHTKGMCAVGDFVATAGAPMLSRSRSFLGPIFQSLPGSRWLAETRVLLTPRRMPGEWRSSFA